MASLTKIVLYISLTVYFFGQLLRINIQHISFPLLDIAIILLAFLNILSKKNYLKKTNLPVIIFAVFSLISLKINLFYYPLSLTSFLYWIRLIALLSFFAYPLIIDKKLEDYFKIILASSIIFGFIQYFFWPDLTYFSTFNWDPHLYRLVGTFFDPTFTALIFLFFLLKIFFQYPSNPWLLLPIYIGMALTYSRSTLLTFFIVFTFIAIKKKNLGIFITTFLLVFLTVLLLPRMPGEGTKLERTSSIKAKIENYKEGYKLFLTSPIIGVGYNNLGTIRGNKQSHANSGFDSSLLTIAVTTGIIGLFFFVRIFTLGLSSTSLYWQCLLLSVFIHSLFANSLLYPWVLFYLALETKYRK
ncbi:MAG TPA: O-antigen ligase family protein [Candidatus Methanoperedens sp.]|nr:O-antigen ligase family protein [Candidatus Methanoperedens sp.]